MAILPIAAFAPKETDSYKTYAKAKEDAQSRISSLEAEKQGAFSRSHEVVSVGTARQLASSTTSNIAVAAGKVMKEYADKIAELEAASVTSAYVNLTDGGKKTITSSSQGMEIEKADATGKKVEEKELLSDGTEITTTYKNGEPDKKYVTNPDGTAKTPQYYNTVASEWQEGDPIPVDAGTKSVNSYGSTYSSVKQYDQTVETLTDGSTRVTIKSQLDDEKYVLTGKLGAGNVGIPEFTEVMSSRYVNPERGLEVTTKGSITTIKDDKKGIDATIEETQVHRPDCKQLKIQYNYRDGIIKSSTISGVYVRNNAGNENNNCNSWSAQNNITEKVEFRDGTTAGIQYEGMGDRILSISGVNLSKEDWEKAGYNPYNPNESKVHTNPLFANFEGNYVPPFSYINSL